METAAHTHTHTYTYTRSCNKERKIEIEHKYLAMESQCEDQSIKFLGTLLMYSIVYTINFWKLRIVGLQ